MTSTLTFHTDPGHGWLEVPISDLADVGLAIGDFSGYSYLCSRAVYLEKDCDAGFFMRTYEAKYGKRPDYTERYSDPCFVRDLPRLPRNDNAASLASFRREG